MRIWKWENRKDGAGSGGYATKAGKGKNSCPGCHSTRVARVLYGLMGFDEELEREIDEGRVSLGGCTVSPGDPTYRCVDCDFEW
jgi:hypothetical protein